MNPFLLLFLTLYFKILPSSSCLLCVITLFFLPFLQIWFSFGPFVHKLVTVFFPCSSRLCLMEMGMNDRVR